MNIPPFPVTRDYARFFHVCGAIILFLYFYTPFYDWPYALPFIRFVLFPAMLISGIWVAPIMPKIWFGLKNQKKPTA